jgi:hypothetical protein
MLRSGPGLSKERICVMKETDLAINRLEDALERHGSHRGSGNFWQCPAQADRTPSLSVSEKSGDKPGVLLKCHAGCETAAIVQTLNLSMAELFDDFGKGPDTTLQGPRKSPEVVATYEYLSASGEPLSTKLRLEPGEQERPKTFRWSRGNPHVLYQLPLVIEAETVWINEGEKAAERLQSNLPAGHAATCAPTTIWEEGFTGHLRGKSVVIAQDRDTEGRKQASEIARNLSQSGVQHRVVVSRTEGAKDDAFDHLEAGFGIDDFVAAEAVNVDLHGEERQLGMLARRLDTIEQRPIRWLWTNKVEATGPTLLDGDADAGKTTLVCDLLARMTAGTDWPDGIPIERKMRVGWIEGAPDDFAWRIAPLPRAVDRESAGGRRRRPRCLRDGIILLRTRPWPFTARTGRDLGDCTFIAGSLALSAHAVR